MQSTLILLRHGQSEWNKKNLFTGWVDIPLSYEGIQEALAAGRQIADLPIDVIFTSSLVRAQMTALIAMSLHRGGKIPLVPHLGKLKEWATIYDKNAAEMTIPIMIAWELNERMYGELQGLNKIEMKKKFGEEQVQTWRRSFDIAPPGGESLANTAQRAVPYFQNHIVPHLEEGKNVLISAHGNSLRAIVMQLENLSKEEIIKFELATGQPLIYLYNRGTFERG